MRTYHGEKAIISLTSWKARINTVAKTLFSLITMCPGFHIVLVLSEEEFPKKEAELPASLMAFANNDLIEILWVYKNYKSFKKYLFTMDKYPNVPVISADDDCIYIRNYAEELYQVWRSNKRLNGIRYEYGSKMQMQGPSSLYFMPHSMVTTIIGMIDSTIIQTGEDDPILYRFMKLMGCRFGYVHKETCKPYVFHDTIAPLHSDETFKSLSCFQSAFVK